MDKSRRTFPGSFEDEVCINDTGEVAFIDS